MSHGEKKVKKVKLELYERKFIKSIADAEFGVFETFN